MARPWEPRCPDPTAKEGPKVISPKDKHSVPSPCPANLLSRHDPLTRYTPDGGSRPLVPSSQTGRFGP